MEKRAPKAEVGGTIKPDVSTSVKAVAQVPMQKKESLIKKLPMTKIQKFAPVIAGIFVIFAGIFTGYVLASPGSSKSGKSQVPSGNSVNGESTTAMEAGVSDESTFSDEAEGTLKEGGINGEGTHYLDRELGPEKNVYLTSTVINLQNYVDKKVQVWGQTIAGQHAGWLMDVGKIKIIE